MSNLDVISDHSKQKLTEVPTPVLQMYNLKMLYLEGNKIEYIPEDFFIKLHKLNWLDLRNNKLKSIPENIAYHEHLENLLLSNNLLERLPNELGLVPKLKVLQISDNPLSYPNRKIIQEGAMVILSYLKGQYEKDNPNLDDCYDDTNSEDIETEVAVVTNFSKPSIPTKRSGTVFSSTTTTQDNKKVLSDLFRRHESPFIIKRLSKDEPTPSTISTKTNKSTQEASITHKLEKNASKISLKSFTNSCRYLKEPSVDLAAEKRMSDAALKEAWLGKLKKILTEQEKILQQERNLKSLSSWRTERKLEPLRPVDPSEISEAPFAIYEEYKSMTSRSDLTKQIDRFIEKSKTPNKKVNIEKAIGDLVSQLKDLENMFSEVKSPRTEIEQAGKQIQMIMNIHKKLLCLQASNDSILQ